MANAILADVEASGIYQIRNLVNGKRYIGSAVRFRTRWAAHRSGFKNNNHPNRLLMRSWLKYGPDAFVFEIVETCEAEYLISREQCWIDTKKPEYNLSPTAGSCLGTKRTKETKAKLSACHKGNKYCVGRKLSAKTKEAIGRANRKRRGFKRAPESVEKTASAHRGMKRSDETRRKISEAMSGKKLKAPRSAECRAKLSEAHRGRPKSPEHAAAFQAGRAAIVFTDDRRNRMSAELKRQYDEGIRSSEKSEEHRQKIGRAVAKLTDSDVREIRLLLENGVTGRELSSRFGVPTSTISQIRNGKSYRWVA